MLHKLSPNFFYVLITIFVLGTSCTNDSLSEPLETESTENPTEEEEPEVTTEETPEQVACDDLTNFIFNEKDGLLLVEFENAEFTEDWKLKSEGSTESEVTFMVWEGEQSLGNPGNGIATYKLKIENAGIYQFLWNSAVKIGDNGSDHNDTWLRFNDASDFYAQNGDGTSIVYPRDIGKTPNPEGASKDGWFKIYRSGNNLDFKWQSSTFDNNAHNVFVDFNEPGIYVMEISARSSGHAIDKFVLFNSSVSKSDATSSMNFSEITCN